MGNGEWVQSHRSGIQEALIKAKREELITKYGAQFGSEREGQLPPDVELDWLNYMLAFERQFALAEPLSVREHIGDPTLVPAAALADEEVVPAVAALLERLAAHEIAVTFLGEITPREQYRYLSGALLDEIFTPIAGFCSNFTYATPAYEVMMWTEQFLLHVFTQDRQLFLPYLDRQVWVDGAGQVLPATAVARRLFSIWRHLPPTTHFELWPLWTCVEAEAATMRATVRWLDESSRTYHKLQSRFRLRPSPYTGWDVIDTTFLDVLARFLKGDATGAEAA